MRTVRTKLLLCIVLAIVAGFLACNKAAAPAAPPEEIYAPATGAVGLDIIRMGNGEGAARWLATYSDGNSTTKFQIEFERATAANSSLLASGKGKFVALPESDPTALLDTLQKALQARHRPNNVQKADALPFEYAVLGDNQSRSPDGGFRGSPKGNWTATKLFLANDQAEVYFNFNPVIHKAEFSIKDRDYGDRVLAELAKVL
jgi:hypothetical protein